MSDQVIRCQYYSLDPEAPESINVSRSELVLRLSAYALILHPARPKLLLTKLANGRLMLSGGKVEAGETAAEAVIREVHEELGLLIRLNGNLSFTETYFYDGQVAQEAYQNIGLFFTADLADSDDVAKVDEWRPNEDIRIAEGIVGCAWHDYRELAPVQLQVPAFYSMIMRAFF